MKVEKKTLKNCKAIGIMRDIIIANDNFYNSVRALLVPERAHGKAICHLLIKRLPRSVKIHSEDKTVQCGPRENLQNKTGLVSFNISKIFISIDL